ncbi:choice-of-anchor M domain-containing protein [Kribbella sp. NPDC056951]|uniref:choice-of-anchor M domain-containing protein n=1 Tax=Kribbella sp. NPDC056951 TaxID=3345978 RepID=UPI00362CB1D1
MKLLAALLLAVAPLAPTADPVVIGNGHVDLGPKFVDGRWTVQLRDDTTDPATWRDLDTVVLQATSKAKIAVPADPAYQFLGKPGQSIWVIPQVQQEGIVWPGWNTQDTEVATRVDREVTWSLEGVRGPGAFTLFLNSDFGKPQPVFDSRKPFPQQTGIDVNTHVHGNWTFDAQGTYLLDVAMTAKLTDGSSVTDRRTLRIYAGEGDPRTALATPTPIPAANATPQEGQPIELWWFIAGAVVLVLTTTGFVVIRRRAS